MTKIKHSAQYVATLEQHRIEGTVTYIHMYVAIFHVARQSSLLWIY